MTTAGPKTPANTPDSVDVDALVARLKEELAGGANGHGDRGSLLAARHRAERLWAVSADRPLERRPGRRGGSPTR
jgi:hypothetical protein